MLLALCMIWTALPGTALGENVTEGMTTDWSSGTYNVYEDVTINGRINTMGADIYLYLHGHTLIVNGGIYVPGGSTLRIYGPGTLEAHAENVDGAAGIGGNEDSSVGSLYIYKESTVLAWGGDGGAGIGGGEDGDGGGGSINVLQSSTVKAWGGNDGAGIGGGDGSSAVPKVDIMGDCIIEAYGNNSGAGIGGGYSNASLNEISLSSSTVTATGGFNGGAGICGDVYIFGGTVTANGKGGGAGIGANKNEDFSLRVRIPAGVVTAESEKYGAGIGGGKDGDFKGWVYIDSGIVTAKGNEGGAGIGAGYAGNAAEGHVIISGGQVRAISTEGGAGIGGGQEGSAGGGGEGCDDVQITENAYVYAQGGSGSCSAIGHGDNDEHMGHITFGAGFSVTAGNVLDGEEGTYERTFSLAEREGACMYRRKAIIRPCDHSGDATYEAVSESGHKRVNCVYCGHPFEEEPHVWDEAQGVCTLCGYESDDVLLTIAFEANGGSDDMASVTYMPERLYTLPECGFTPPEGVAFFGWTVSVDGTPGADALSGRHFPGDKILLPGEGVVTLTAQWGTDATITFDAGEGTGEMDPVAFYTGGEYTLPPCGFTGPEWYYFKGWAVNGDTENLKQPLEIIDITGDTALTAIWDRERRQVTFDSIGSSAVPVQDVWNGMYAQRPDDPVWKDHLFLGWYLDDQLYDFEQTPVTRDMTLTAKWADLWALLQTQIDNAASGDTITLSEDITAEAGDAALTIPADKEIILDLNGHTLDRARAESEYNGWVITVKGGLTLRGGGEVTGGWNIGDCGGVYVNGSLTLEDCAITGNKAERSSRGGGVYVAPYGEFMMNGGCVSHNQATYGGGVFIAYKGEFTMNDGSVSSNMADYGGGVSVYRGANPYGGTFTMNGGNISGNTADSAGGVFVHGSEFTMSGGEISGNTADAAAGVYAVMDAVFTMTGGEISGNDASLLCGGVIFDDGSFNVSGSPVVRNNTSSGSTPDNVYLVPEQTIGITGELSGEALLWVTMMEPGTFTSGFAGNGTLANFRSDDPNGVLGLTEDGEACLGVVFGTPDFTLPSDVKSIEESAFEGIAARVVYIPDGCETIGAYAFKGCPNLKQIRVPAGCAIGESAFDGCEHVTIFGTTGSDAEEYCESHDNCEFAAE